MAKILLTITALLILAFIVVAMYCACVLAGRSDENENNSDNNEGADDMFLKKQICPRCRQANILMTSILNQKLARTSGVGDVTNVAFINHLKSPQNRAYLRGIKTR